MTDTVIRASATSGYADCPKRAAARLFENDIRALGYELRRLPPHIGAVTGTATHVAIYWPLAQKIETGELGDQKEAEARAMVSLADGASNGVMWDGVTATMNVAQQQVLRQARSFRRIMSPHIDPELVEARIEAPSEGGIVVSGQVDVYDRSGTLLADVKTGKMSRWNAPQYGTYSRLLRTAGKAVKRIEEHYVPRVALSEPQPDPTIIPYDVAAAERASAAAIKHIARDLADFRASGNPDAFLPNPHSYLCSDKFCPAHSTSFCSAWKK